MNRAESPPPLPPSWLVAGDAPPTPYHRDTVLESHLPGLPAEARGRTEVLSFLEARLPGGASLGAWSTIPSPGGMVVKLEILDDGRPSSRERHLVHVEDGRITRHILYPERISHQVDDSSLRELASVVPGTGSEGFEREPLPPGFSGAPLERLTSAEQTYIVKHLAPRWSWVMRATGDDGREALLWRDGALAGLEASVDPAIVTSVQLPDRWLLYMRDVSEVVSTAPDGDRLRAALAPMYAASPLRPVEDLCPLPDRLSLFSPTTAEREAEGTDLGPKIIGRGWELIEALLPGDLVSLARSLAGRPEPLARALSTMGSCVIHGDLRPGNLGLSEDRLVLIDWGLATWGPPALDLLWFAFNQGWSLPLDARLAAAGRGAKDTEAAAFDLSVIATFIQVCPYFGFTAVQEPDPVIRERARSDLGGWADAARQALDRSGGLIDI